MSDNIYRPAVVKPVSTRFGNFFRHFAFVVFGTPGKHVFGTPHFLAREKWPVLAPNLTISEPFSRFLASVVLVSAPIKQIIIYKYIYCTNRRGWLLWMSEKFQKVLGTGSNLVANCYRWLRRIMRRSNMCEFRFHTRDLKKKLYTKQFKWNARKRSVYIPK